MGFFLTLRLAPLQEGEFGLFFPTRGSLKEGRRVWAGTCVSPVQSRVGGEVGDDYKWRKPLTSTLAKAIGLF